MTVSTGHKTKTLWRKLKKNEKSQSVERNPWQGILQKYPQNATAGQIQVKTAVKIILGFEENWMLLRETKDPDAGLDRVERLVSNQEISWSSWKEWVKWCKADAIREDIWQISSVRRKQSPATVLK